ncbi:unnamed protein product [Heterotrigona itama]|uniref:Uncharacterized protein n=1 Tax=Heterotrigona itama TaxID=395501 RepID=A0A6V7H7Q0_9HYME|nr:unnamed protein product [Heterotrigona itama]
MRFTVPLRAIFPVCRSASRVSPWLPARLPISRSRYIRFIFVDHRDAQRSGREHALAGLANHHDSAARNVIRMCQPVTLAAIFRSKKVGLSKDGYHLADNDGKTADRSGGLTQMQAG